MKRPSYAEVTARCAAAVDEAGTLQLALMFVAGGIEADSVEAFSVGERGERERYKLALYGSTRADGGTVVQIRTYPGQGMPDVTAFRLDAGRCAAQVDAWHNGNLFTWARRDALDRLYAKRNALAQAHYDAKKG